jgi:hypothetical protein
MKMRSCFLLEIFALTASFKYTSACVLNPACYVYASIQSRCVLNPALCFESSPMVSIATQPLQKWPRQNAHRTDASRSDTKQPDARIRLLHNCDSGNLPGGSEDP